MNIALYQPDIAANVGSILRLCACTGCALHIIEPCGFPFDDKRLRRSGMDYIEHVRLIRHFSWENFLDYYQSSISGRLILLSTRAGKAYTDIDYTTDDILLMGRESVGVPDTVRQACMLTATIPMQPGMRSLNVALAAAMVLGEAIRQTT
ncbi:MAG: tRNA (cytidine(34)-2'-O)-methyltransferase [Alphaproteobacteria bacterium]